MIRISRRELEAHEEYHEQVGKSLGYTVFEDVFYLPEEDFNAKSTLTNAVRTRVGSGGRFKEDWFAFCQMHGFAPRPSFRGMNLRTHRIVKRCFEGMNFRRVDLRSTTLYECSFESVDFTGADLRRAEFVDCNMSAAKFNSADMRGTKFTSCACVETEFKRSDMRHCHVYQSNFLSAFICKCDLRFAEFNRSDLSGCWFAGNVHGENGSRTKFFKASRYVHDESVPGYVRDEATGMLITEATAKRKARKTENGNETR